MYYHSLHRGRKHFSSHHLHDFITEKNLKRHIKDSFKINIKKTIKTNKKNQYVNFKNLEGKLKSPFMIYSDFESILVTEGNGKQNPNKCSTKKYQKTFACCYGYKLACIDDKFS